MVDFSDEFAVLVNTRHPTIREVLSQKLNEVTQHMQEGKKFCLKVRKHQQDTCGLHPFLHNSSILQIIKHVLYNIKIEDLKQINIKFSKF